MSTIAKVASLKAQIAALQEDVAAIESSDQYKVESEIHGKVTALMAEYGKSIQDIANLIAPAVAPAADKAKPTKKRRERETITYVNPHTGQKVQTKGANQRTLREWREEYGAEVVASWRQDA